MLRRIATTLLRVPLFYKILVVNAGMVIVGAVAGTVVTVQFARTASPSGTIEILVVVILAGLLLSVALNALILRLALKPVRDLEVTAARIEEGNDAIRAPISALADAETESLITTFNAMLDRLDLYRQSLRETARRAVGAQEEERKRIARELHDDTAQRLASLQIRLALARREADPVRRNDLLEEIRDGLEEAGLDVRRFARGLRPPALDELGLLAALEAHGRQLQEETGITVDVEGQKVSDQLDPTTELAAYRIVQEALTNASHHASPNCIRVVLAQEQNEITVSVTDDGLGFDPDAVQHGGSRGLGLFGMRERAVYVGGEVEITSAPGSGTTVTLHLPVEERRSNG